jgi:hypothetical protein
MREEGKMNRGLLICISIFTIMAFLGGCAGQLAVKQTFSDPPQSAPGEKVKIIVEFKGPKNKVSEVIATVQEAPNFRLPLNDQGENGDEKPGDNIWSSEGTVPTNTPANTYHLDILARDTEGNEIITPGLEQQEYGRSGAVEVVIE